MGTFGRAPAWGSKWKAFVRENAGRWSTAYLQTNSFPYENTYLDLDPEVRDPLGDPVCRVTSGPKENEARAATFAQDKMEEWYRAAGAIEVVKGQPFGPALSTHAYGGTRMGDNPETNVVDRWGFSHEAAESGAAGRLGIRHQRRAQPDADNSGAGVADGRTSGEELEIDGWLKLAAICRPVRSGSA